MKNQDGQTNKEGALSRHRPFMTLMTAQLISNLGTWLYLLALLTLVGLKWEATPWEISAVSLCMAIPLMLGGPIAGYISDKMNRRTLMIIADLSRAFIVCGLVFVESLWQVYLILILKSIMDILFSPAKSGKLKEIIPHDKLPQAVAVSSGIEQLTKILGPAAGGLLVAVFGLEACFYINAGTFLISAVILFMLPKHSQKVGTEAGLEQMEAEEEESSDSQKRSIWREIGAGVGILAAMPLVFFGLIVLMTVMLVLQIADSQTVTLFRIIPGVPDDLLGWCIAASGLGTLIAAILAGKGSSAWKPLSKMAIGAAVMGLTCALAAVAVATGQAGLVMFVELFAAFFMVGLGAGLTFIPFQTLLQQRTPSHLIGRVFGTVNSLTSAAVVLGPVIGGALVTAYGPVLAFIVSGVLMMLVGILLMLFRSIIETKDEQALLRFEAAQGPAA